MSQSFWPKFWLCLFGNRGIPWKKEVDHKTNAAKHTATNDYILEFVLFILKLRILDSSVSVAFSSNPLNLSHFICVLATAERKSCLHTSRRQPRIEQAQTLLHTHTHTHTHGACEMVNQKATWNDATRALLVVGLVLSFDLHYLRRPCKRIEPLKYLKPIDDV